MSRRQAPLLVFLLLLVAPEIQAQTNLYTFTGNDGKFYRHIKIIRIDSDSVLYTVADGAGGGRMKFSQMPDDIIEKIKNQAPREKTFADSLPAAQSDVFSAEGAASNRAGNGEKSDSAMVDLTNNTAHAICTFSRTVATNAIDYLISITYFGTNYLGLGSADSLTFDADGTLVTYSPAPGTHRVEAEANQMSETQAYKTSFRDLQKICQARTLGIALSGPLGNDNFAVPPANILKNFGHYCLTNASALAAGRTQPVRDAKAAEINSPPESSPATALAEVLEATARSIDDNAYTTQWAWKVTLRAPATPPKDFLLEFQFLDAEGYVLAHEVEFPVKLNAGQTNTLTGQAAIKTALSGRIKTCKVVMR